MLYAFQSVVLLMILTRTVGLVYAGVFTLAYANANLFLNIGKYGMRNYQVSDVEQQYSFGEYLLSRKISVFLMMLSAVVYVIYAAHTRDYSSEKSWIIVWMCCFKAADAVEDVYYGEYQRQGRLDIAAKIMTLRLGVSLLLFSAIVVINGSLLWALIVSTLASILLLYICLKQGQGFFTVNGEKRAGKVRRLMGDCFPLAAGAFLSFYIGNAPKYAIDSLLSDELQACYGFIAMPVFVIGLLNGFVFTPMMYRMSVQWNDRKYNEFIKGTFFQVGIVAAVTIVCIVGAWAVGIPVLSFLYNTDLTAYKPELLILLGGGGFLGLSGLMNALLTVMRKQTGILISYVIAAGCALVFSAPIVGRYEMLGASLLYMVLMGILCVCFGMIYIYTLTIHMKEETSYEKSSLN
ncbi:MAG: lipopolysaccharide biosynthesis protein [Lachnospiraceae bacterium]|nr:lipopolysaccharide biosynthesis protein [Lachnospiraceae bacterium]